MDADELARRFTFHPAGADRAAKHERLRRGGLTLAELICELVPEGPEQVRAINAVDEAVMLANAGLARPTAPSFGVSIDSSKLVMGRIVPGSCGTGGCCCE